MKTLTSIHGSPFYNSAPSLPGLWYGTPRPDARKKRYLTQPLALEEHKRKQEMVCAVILALSLLFAFVECIAGFAVS